MRRRDCLPEIGYEPSEHGNAPSRRRSPLALDLHTHILPGVDDGPATLEESIEMALIAYGDGTRTLVASPHSRDVNERSSIAVARSLVERLNRELLARSVSLEVVLGMENHLAMDTPDQVDNGRALPIQGTRYILVELPFEFFPFYAEDALLKLRLRGLRPIVVHPERNLAVQKNPQLLANMARNGTLFQITAGSISGLLGRDPQRTSRELLQRNLAHVIASDGHAARGARAPVLSHGVAAAAEIIGDEAARRMVESVPQAILQDRAPDLGQPPGDSTSRGGGA